MLTLESLLVLVFTAAVCVVVAGAVASALIRKRPVAMVLLAQAHIILLAGVIWQR